MIPVSCQRCGQHRELPDSLAGQDTACDHCGATLLVPPAAKGVSYPLVWWIACAVAVVMACGLLFLPQVGCRGGDTDRATAMNHLSIVLRSVMIHSGDQGKLPPAVIRDKSGQPLASGFVRLLPYLEGKIIFWGWRLEEAWDSPANLRFSSQGVIHFLHPGSGSPLQHRTDLAFVVGPGTVWEDDANPATLNDIKAADGLHRTILFIEIKDSQQPWAAPGGWNPWTHQGPIEGNTPGKLLVGMADGRAIHLDTSDPNLLQLLRELADFRDGKPAKWPP